MSAVLRVRVNGTAVDSTAGTLSALLRERGISVDERGVAVAVNGRVVPRAEWPATAVRTGDEVEIVRAVQGG